MACHKSITIAFAGFRKTGHAAKLAQMIKFLPAAGEELMDIGLMSHIEYQPIHPGIEHGFDGNAKLYNAQVGSKMATGLGHMGDQKRPDIIA